LFQKPATGIEFDDDETDTNDDRACNEAVHDKVDVGAADEVVTDKDDNAETSSDDEEVRLLLQKVLLFITSVSSSLYFS
jgi:hypothetical protein